MKPIIVNSYPINGSENISLDSNIIITAIDKISKPYDLKSLERNHLYHLVDNDIKVTTIERDLNRYQEALKNIKKFNLEDRIKVIFNDFFWFFFSIFKLLIKIPFLQ